MQCSSEVWADWNFDCTLNSVDKGVLGINVKTGDTPFTLRNESGGSALDEFSSSMQSQITDNFSILPWQA
jgi:hypothetical protein